MFNSPFADLLEFDPRLAYFSQAGRAGQSPFARRFFNSSFSRLQDQFFGQLGQQIMRGDAPNLRFTDFLNGLDFQNDLAKNFAASRSRFNPPTRFAY